MSEEKKADIRAQMNKLLDWAERRDEIEMEYINSCIAHCDMQDEDGYPTAQALDCIERWPWKYEKQWFEFIHDLWHLKSFGWSEGEAPHDWDKDKIVYRYEISTAGWSGNESIIRAMEKNDAMWSMVWVQSRRGGHYVFELYGWEDKDGDS